MVYCSLLVACHSLAQSNEHRPLYGRMRHVLDLDPFAAAPRAVATIAPLGDDPFKPHDACLPEQDCAVYVLDMLAAVLVLFFLLLAGDTFLRRLVEILPRFSDKRQAVDIWQKIESDISIYLLTITIMNACVGIATALVMWLCGLGDPILWGAVAFLLNYVPILGPTFGVVTFILAGLLTIDSLWVPFCRQDSNDLMPLKTFRLRLRLPFCG
jgi:hypothetical protein